MNGCSEAIANMQKAQKKLEDALNILEKDLVMTDEAFKRDKFKKIIIKIDEPISEVSGL